MYNVLIVDDEKWICELIHSAVSWHKLDMQVFGTAGNGLEALKVLEENDIDVVITDIRMPGMDGITLIQKARENGYKGQFIIISGYQDFEYAKNVIPHNVKSYLVKPVDEDELTVILYKIAEELKESERDEHDHILVKTRLDSVSRHMKEQFTRLAIIGDIQKHSLINSDMIEELGFSHSKCITVIFHIDGNPGSVPDNNILQILIERLTEYINKTLSDQGIVFAYCVHDQNAVYIFNFDGDEPVSEGLKSHMTELKHLVSSYRQYALTVGVGSVVSGIDRIPDSYRDADKAVKYRLVAGRNQFIESGNLDFDNTELRLTGEQKRKLVSLVEALDTEGIPALIEEVLDPSEPSGMNPVILFSLAREIWVYFSGLLAEARFSVSVKEQEVISRMESSSSANMLIGCLAGIMSEEFDKFRQQKKETYSGPIAVVKNYISENFGQQISLNDAAAFVHLHPNYLSKLFKAETGFTFLEYLTGCRIDKAKDMLKDFSSKMTDIPGLVGYRDMRHFVKVFRKNTGLTPREYRKLFM